MNTMQNMCVCMRRCDMAVVLRARLAGLGGRSGWQSEAAAAAVIPELVRVHQHGLEPRPDRSRSSCQSRKLDRWCLKAIFVCAVASPPLASSGKDALLQRGFLPRSRSRQGVQPNRRQRDDRREGERRRREQRRRREGK